MLTRRIVLAFIAATGASSVARAANTPRDLGALIAETDPPLFASLAADPAAEAASRFDWTRLEAAYAADYRSGRVVHVASIRLSRTEAMRAVARHMCSPAAVRLDRF